MVIQLSVIDSLQKGQPMRGFDVVVVVSVDIILVWRHRSQIIIFRNFK